MKSFALLFSLIFMPLFLVGCGSAPYKDSGYTSRLTAKNNKADIKPKLMAQYKEWRGTAYKHGGLSKRGIDCSGFVYLTYLNQFGIRLPRSTEQQALSGMEISPDELRPGDLVFFNSLFSGNHVGIYLGSGQFLHASTSRGVMISKLDDDHWRDTFWKAQRI
jgi:lipoprotein Spr/probable lipoprotein NlpC